MTKHSLLRLHLSNAILITLLLPVIVNLFLGRFPTALFWCGLLVVTGMDSMFTIWYFFRWRKNRLLDDPYYAWKGAVIGRTVKIRGETGAFKVLYHAWRGGSLATCRGEASLWAYIVERQSDSKKFRVKESDLISLSPLEQLASCAE